MPAQQIAGPKLFRVTAVSTAPTPFTESPPADDALYVACVPPGDDDDSVRQWVGSDARRVKSDSFDLRLGSNRALVIAPPSRWPGLQQAIHDVWTIELSLTQMESHVAPVEATATADVPLAYEIRGVDRRHWPRLRRTMETLAVQRLQLARLEPQLDARGSLPIVARRARRQLLAALDLPHRVESFGDRLEACEDLYEGAVDRITDFNWWQKGHFLEIAIVALLLLETTLLIGELYARLHGR